jgi:AraC-like DNA-binding protein
MPYWLLMRFRTPFFYVCDGETYTAEADELLLNAPDTPLIHGATDTKNGFCNDWIYFAGDEAAELIEKLGIPQGRAFSLSDASFFERRLKEILSEMKSCEVGYTHKISALIACTLIDVGRACKSENIVSEYVPVPYERSVKNVHTAITENCGYPWTLSEMAELSGYSVSRFCALYKSQYGTTPTEYLIKRRISRAKHLLGSGEHNVTETSELCGFSSLHYFSVTFKKYVGCSPSAFMESRRKDTVSDDDA